MSEPGDERRENDGVRRPGTADLLRDHDEAEASAPVGEGSEQERQPLFAAADAERFSERWTGIQAGFVDEPRNAVQEADALVAELMQRLAETFSTERSTLESQWDREEDVSTEDLRLALQRYRSFFDRLLSA